MSKACRNQQNTGCKSQKATWRGTGKAERQNQEAQKPKSQKTKKPKSEKAKTRRKKTNNTPTYLSTARAYASAASRNIRMGKSEKKRAFLLSKTHSPKHGPAKRTKGSLAYFSPGTVTFQLGKERPAVSVAGDHIIDFHVLALTERTSRGIQQRRVHDTLSVHPFLRSYSLMTYPYHDS